MWLRRWGEGVELLADVLVLLGLGAALVRVFAGTAAHAGCCGCVVLCGALHVVCAGILRFVFVCSEYLERHMY